MSFAREICGGVAKPFLWAPRNPPRLPSLVEKLEAVAKDIFCDSCYQPISPHPGGTGAFQVDNAPGLGVYYPRRTEARRPPPNRSPSRDPAKGGHHGFRT